MLKHVTGASCPAFSSTGVMLLFYMFFPRRVIRAYHLQRFFLRAFFFENFRRLTARHFRAPSSFFQTDSGFGSLARFVPCFLLPAFKGLTLPLLAYCLPAEDKDAPSIFSCNRLRSSSSARSFLFSSPVLTSTLAMVSQSQWTPCSYR